jgi:hypothetical protein
LHNENIERQESREMAAEALLSLYKEHEEEEDVE